MPRQAEINAPHLSEIHLKRTLNSIEIAALVSAGSLRKQTGEAMLCALFDGWRSLV